MMTSSVATKRLRLEEMERTEKKRKKVEKRGKSTARKLKRMQKRTSKEEDEEEDAKCVGCNRWWSKFKGKKGDSWVQCNTVMNIHAQSASPKILSNRKNLYAEIGVTMY